MKMFSTCSQKLGEGDIKMALCKGLSLELIVLARCLVQVKNACTKHFWPAYYVQVKNADITKELDDLELEVQGGGRRR